LLLSLWRITFVDFIFRFAYVPINAEIAYVIPID